MRMRDIIAFFVCCSTVALVAVSWLVFGFAFGIATGWVIFWGALTIVALACFVVLTSLADEDLDVAAAAF